MKGIRPDGLPYRKILFQTGELCPIQVGDNVVCLAAFCNSSDPFSSEQVTVADYMEYWDSLWHNLSRLTIDKGDVYVTVPGGNLIKIAGTDFSIEQSLGIALQTYFRFATVNQPIAHLHFCVSEADVEKLDLPAWVTTLIPYLYGFSRLPISVILKKIPSEFPLEGEYIIPRQSETPFERLISDLRNMFRRAAKYNGTSYDQFEGSKAVTVTVAINWLVLQSVLDEIRRHPDLVRYFGKAKGNGYDRNAIFQILGALIESSGCFGHLNRRSVVTLCLGDEYTKYGDSLDNIINYVGQRLKTFKTTKTGYYNQLLDCIDKSKAQYG